MPESTALTCPSCGAPLPLEHRFVRMVACKYCDTLSEITDTGLDPTGKVAKLVPLPTRFSVGQTGRIQGRPFRILGRIRYAYDEGMWDEWFVSFDNGSMGWLEEDDGECILARMERLRTPVPPFEHVRVGTSLTVNDYQIFITERCRARVAGAEGQLLFPVQPGKAVNLVEGNTSGRIAFIEYVDDEIEFGLGEPLDWDEIVLEDNRC